MSILILRTVLSLTIFSTLSLCKPPIVQQPFLEPESSTNLESEFNLLHAQRNAPEIFNTIHSSLRQWGSSLQHNGMSFFPAQIPANTLLYHGTHASTSPSGMEWLAFEIEHAEMFARPRMRRPPPHDPPQDPSPPQQSRLPFSPLEVKGRDETGANEELDEPQHGYLQIYKTKKKLDKLLYIDGQSAAKSSFGTLDSQDLILRNATRDSNLRSDYTRALELCALYPSLDGFIRMEAGFELILCNFTTGVEIVDVVERKGRESDSGRTGGAGRDRSGSDEGDFEDEMVHFEYLRALEKRYGGIMAGRISLDYSSMVSVYFHGMNLTNPNLDKKELPRLPADDKEGLENVRRDLMDLLNEQEKMENHHESRGIDWQGVVDMIVTRYSDRLILMASNSTTRQTIAAEIDILLDVFIDYSDLNTSTSIDKCVKHYLRPITPRTRQDHLIHAAISSVANKICTTLFTVRELVSAEKDSMEDSKQELVGLLEFLNWTTWLECGKCEYDQVCFVAIWPWGSLEDHQAPACRGMKDIKGRTGYWEMGPRGH